MGYGTRPPRVRANVDPNVMNYLARLERQAMRRAPAAPDAQMGRFLRGIDRQMPAAEPLADMVNRANRTDTLLNSRVQRMTPDEQRGSLTAVWAQAQKDAADAAATRRMADTRRSQDFQTGATIAGLGALGAGAFGARVAQEAGLGRSEEDPESFAEPDLPAVVSRPEPTSTWWGEAEEDIVPPTIDLGDNDLGDMALEDDIVVPFEPEIFMGPEDRAILDSMDDPLPDWWTKRTTRDYALPLGMLSPEESVSMSPGPESEVDMGGDLEDLPAPQMRSIAALIQAGVPEQRATDIILRGSSMSPDEYRMVTGGRR